jgi:Tol biopolymer transport system component
MTLSAGTRLGPYEILSPLGAGGMGEVYKARDTRLGRGVAVKVLPSHLSDNTEFRQRFEREARAVSQLSHPHICALYDVGTHDSTEFLVMELLEGQTLAQRLEKGALPAEQVLRAGIEIADALDRAHRHGIVHRDLKPGNVMLTKSGVKLLDFGLAKVGRGGTEGPGEGGLSSLPTEGAQEKPLTEKGTVLGTFQYMSPEQLEGAAADARSDIFALGAVLYEMATGKKAFTGKSRVSLIGSILRDEPPPISSVQPMTPPALDRVVKTCLAKDPDERWQSAHDVMSELKWIAEGGSQAGAPIVVSSRRKIRERMTWLIAAAAALAALLLAAAYLRRPSPSVVRFSLLPPEKTNYFFAGDNAGPVAVSPDGRSVAFVAAGEFRPILYVRPLDALAASPLAGTEDARFPFWSPDSRTIGFFAQGKLKRIDVSAGGVLGTICEAPNPRGGTWNRDGVILFAPDTRQAIFRVSASGGTMTPVTKLDAAIHTTHRWPVFLPDGRHFLYFAGDHNDVEGEKAGVYFASLDGRENRRVVHTLAAAVYSSGSLLYLRGSSILAQPFDPSTGRLSGEAALVAEGVAFDLSTWHGVFSASADNVLAYQAGEAGGTRLVWYDRAGKILGTLGEKANYYGPPRISPDGRRIAVTIDNPGDVFIFDGATGIRTRLTFSPSSNLLGGWSSDGAQIAFGSIRKVGRFGTYVKKTSGAAPEQGLLVSAEAGYLVTDWSRDGRYLSVIKTTPGKGRHLLLVPLAGDGKPRELLAEHDGDETDAAFSPDSRWIAYTVFTAGPPAVFVAPVPGPGGKWEVSTTGGYNPRWRGDGQELYFLAPDLTLMAAKVDRTGSEFRVGQLASLFQTRAASNPGYGYDVAADGKRILVDSLESGGGAPLTLVLNWKEGLKK